MRPKCKQLSRLHEKQKVVVGGVCSGIRRGYAELLVSISSKEEDEKFYTRLADVSERDCLRHV